MFKPEQVLIINPPHELKFTGNATLMKLKNPTNDAVFFKIKTTAPKRYCVRPNSGMLLANEAADIIISPQPSFYDSNEKCKHKFMVQSVVATADKDLDQVFKEASPEQIMDTKLKCVFEIPPGAVKTENAADASKTENTPKRLASEESKVTQVSSKTSYEQAETEDKSAEVPKILEEITKLKQENIILKEEVQRLRHSTRGAGESVTRHSYDPPQKDGTIFKPSYLAMVIGVAIFGIIIGKFLM